MKFPWQRRAEQAEASAAKVDVALERVKQQRRESEEIALAARHLRERNHFADAIASLLGDKK